MLLGHGDIAIGWWLVGPTMALLAKPLLSENFSIQYFIFDALLGVIKFHSVQNITRNFQITHFAFGKYQIERNLQLYWTYRQQLARVVSSVFIL